MAQLLNILDNNELIEKFKENRQLSYNDIQDSFRECTYGLNAFYIGNSNVIYHNVYGDNYDYKTNDDYLRKLNQNEIMEKINNELNNYLSIEIKINNKDNISYVDIDSDVFKNNLNSEQKIEILEKNITILNDYFKENNTLLKEQVSKYKNLDTIDPITKINIVNKFENKCREINSSINIKIDLNQNELEKYKTLKSLDVVDIDFDIFKNIN